MTASAVSVAIPQRGIAPTHNRLPRIEWLNTAAVWLLVLGQSVVPDFRWDIVDADTEPSYAIQLAKIFGAYLLASIVIWRRRSRIPALLPHVSLLLVGLLGWLCLTGLWSVDPMSAVKNMVRMVGMGMVGFALCTGPRTHDQALAPIRGALAGVMVSSILFSLLLPAYGEMPAGITSAAGGEWRGITAHKNRLGQIAVFSAILWAHAVAVRRGPVRRWPLVWFGASVLAVLGTTSSTSLFAMLLGVVPVMILCRPGGVRLARSPLLWIAGLSMISLLVYTVLLALGIPTFQELVAPFAGAVGKNVTLTGRTDIWAAMMPFVRENWLIGSGWGAFWTDGVGLRRYAAVTTSWLPGSAHNGYLDVVNEGGAIAMALLLGFLVSYGRTAWQMLPRDPAAAVHLMIVVNLLFTNLTESGFISPKSVPETMMMMGGAMLFCFRYNTDPCATPASGGRAEGAREVAGSGWRASVLRPRDVSGA